MAGRGNGARQRREEGPRSCFACARAEHLEWSALSEEALRDLDRAKVVLRFQEGQTLYSQGSPCNGIYCLRSGTVALRRSNANGDSVLVRMAHAGQTLGYTDYFGRKGHTVSADALTAGTACYLERAVVEGLLAVSPKLGLRFLAHLAEDVEQAEESFLLCVSLSVRARLAHLLLTLSERYAQPAGEGGVEISLPLNRQDMAALLGSRPETIARAIAALSADRVALFNRRRVLVPSVAVLLDEIGPRAS